MFHKDTIRLIKNTFNRFFSLLMMVLIGSAFMMGLLSTKLIMKGSVDVFNDENRLHDIQIYSSYGFDDDDLDALKKEENVEYAFASKQKDILCSINGGSPSVTRVSEVERDVNLLTLKYGRFPEKGNEALILSGGGNDSYYIGRTVTLIDESDDITESFRNTDYTIVGVVKSPEYISKMLGSSNLNNRDLSNVLYIPGENFLQDYYTCIYLTLDNASSYISYTDEYENFVTESVSDIKGFAIEQQEKRKADVLEEANKELEEGTAEFEEKKAEGEKKLADAKKLLDDSNIKLLFMETTLDTNQATLDASKKEIEKNETILSINEKQLNDAIKEIEAQDSEGRTFDEIYQELEAGYTMYQALKLVADSSLPDDKETQIKDLEAQNAALSSDISSYEKELESLRSTLEALPADSPEREDMEAQIRSYELRITAARSRIAANDAFILQLQNSESGSIKEMAKAAMEEIDQSAGGSIETAYVEITAVKEGQKKIEDGKAQLESGKAQLEQGEKQLSDGRATLASLRAQYNRGVKEYEDGLYTFTTEIEKAEDELKKARQTIDELPAASWIFLDRNGHYSSVMYKESCDQMGSIGVSLPVLFFLVAALVCMTTMTRLIDEQRGQIGIFRALGFSKGKIISKYVIYAGLASLAGSILGVVIGMAIFPIVIYDAWTLMYMLPGMKIIVSPSILLICVLSFALLMCIVSMAVVRISLKDVPSQLMRPKAPKSSKPIFLEKIRFIWNRFSFTGKITARNLIRYKSRFLMTVIGVAGCTGLLVVGWGIKNSIADIVNIQFGDIFNYQYTVNLQDDRNMDEFLQVLTDDLDVNYSVPYMGYSTKYYDGKTDDKTLNAVVIDAKESRDIFNFRRAGTNRKVNLGANGVLVSEKFAKNNGIHKGDIITIESKSGYKADVVVEDVVEFYFQHYVFISESYYKSVFGEAVHPGAIAVSAEDGEKLVSEVSSIEGYRSTGNFNSMISNFNNMIEALDYIIMVIIITAGALALVVLINLTQVNISERMREIATLKVLGFRNGEVNAYLFKEILLLSVIGGILGMPLGVLEHHFIMNIISMEMIQFGSVIRPMSFVYAFLITILFTLFVLQLTKKPLRKIKMVESLKSVE